MPAASKPVARALAAKYLAVTALVAGLALVNYLVLEAYLRTSDSFAAAESSGTADAPLEARAARLRSAARWTLAGTLVVLGAVAWCVGRPLLRRVEREIDDLAERNAALQQQLAAGSELAQHQDRALAFSEGALRTQSNLLHLILDSMGDGVIVAESERTFLLINAAARDMLHIGDADPAPDVWSADWPREQGVEISLPDGRPCPADVFPLAKAMRGQPADRVLFMLRRPVEPHTLWVSVTARPLRDQSGRNRGGVVVLRDVTERHRAEQILQDSEALYRSLVDNLPLYMLRKDLRGRFTFVNELFLRLLERRREEVIGRTDDDFYPAELAQKYRADDRRVIETGEVFQQVEEHRTPDGQVWYVEVLKAPVRDASGAIVGTQTAFWDVTRRRQAEEALREMNLVLEHAAEGICRVGQGGTLLSANRALAAALGWSPADLVGKPWLQLVFSDDRPKVCRALEWMQLEGRGQSEVRLVRRDGSVFHAEVLLLRPQSEREHTVSHYFFTRDISERKAAQEIALQSERLAAIGQMVAGVAHESRNALQQIQACARMLEWHLANDTEALELVGDLQAAQHRLLRLFDDLRGYAAPIKLGPRRANVASLLAESLRSLRRVDGSRDIELCEHVLTEQLECSVDPFHIDQVFRNVLDNALAACEDPVRIEVTYRDARLDAEPALEISICDNGPGLDDEQQRNIFQAFYTTKTQGSGLGMAIAKRIVDAHGGQIAARSRPDWCGAEIVITLPRGDDEHPANCDRG
jgi:PAS domain S-box-containing protein